MKMPQFILRLKTQASASLKISSTIYLNVLHKPVPIPHVNSAELVLDCYQQKACGITGGTIAVKANLAKAPFFSFSLSFKQSSKQINRNKPEEAFYLSASLKGTKLLIAEDNQINADACEAVHKAMGNRMRCSRKRIVALQLVQTND